MNSNARLLIIKSVPAHAGQFKHSGRYMLISGRWHALHHDEPAPKPHATAPEPVHVPEFQEGKVATGVVEYYNGIAKKLLELASTGNVAALEAEKAKGLTPNAKGKVSNTWAGRTENSKMFLAMYDQIVAHVQGHAKQAAVQHLEQDQKQADIPAEEKAEDKKLVAELKEKEPAAAVAAAVSHLKQDEDQSNLPAAEKKQDAGLVEKLEAAQAKPPLHVLLDQMPWDSQKLPDSNRNARSHNRHVDKIRAMAYAGDLAGLEAFSAVSRTNTYGRKQNLLARTAIAAINEANPKLAKVDAAAHEAATSPHNDKPAPTEAQADAGNYAKGHTKVAGLGVTIENPRGSTRSGKRPDGSTWSHQMSDHYGYIKRTTGADGEHVDVYVGPHVESEKVFVVDQVDAAGKFDEHKVMLGFSSKDEAIAAYSSNFDAGWKVGPVTEMSAEQFKGWLKDGDTTKPVAKPTKEYSIIDRAKSVGVKGVREGMRDDVLLRKLTSHLAGEKASNYIKAGKLTDLPQYKAIKDADTKRFAGLVADNRFSVDTSQIGWVFDGRNKGEMEELVTGGILEEGNDKYKHRLTGVGKEIAHLILSKFDKNPTVEGVLSELEALKAVAKKPEQKVSAKPSMATVVADDAGPQEGTMTKAQHQYADLLKAIDQSDERFRRRVAIAEAKENLVDAAYNRAGIESRAIELADLVRS